MNRREIAHLLGCTERQITYWAEESDLPRTAAKRAYSYDPVLCVAWRIAYERAKLTGVDADGTVVNLTEKRGRKLDEEFRSLRIKNDESEGLLGSIPDLKVTLSFTINSIVSRLDAIPAEVRRRMPHLSSTDVTEIHTVIADIRNDIHGTDPDFNLPWEGTS